MHPQTHPNAARIVRDFEAWGEAADADTPELIEGLGQYRAGHGSIATAWHATKGEALADYHRQLIALRLNGPKRPGHVDADDANHLPLFVAANEPELLL